LMSSLRRSASMKVRTQGKASSTILRTSCCW